MAYKDPDYKLIDTKDSMLYQMPIGWAAAAAVIVVVVAGFVAIYMMMSVSATVPPEAFEAMTPEQIQQIEQYLNGIQ
jgi:hypothetical protein